MAFGESRLDTIDDASAALSSARGRVRILAARLRMVLTDEDVDELWGLLADLDRAHAHWLSVRASLSEADRTRFRRQTA